MDQPPKRAHRATGKKPPGGKRDGAGRTPGAKNTLGYGEVKAVKATKLRLPETATQHEAELAGRALQRIVDVMEDRVSSAVAGTVLKAATRLREEVCGPIVQKLQHSGSVSIAVVDPYAEPKGRP